MGILWRLLGVEELDGSTSGSSNPADILGGLGNDLIEGIQEIMRIVMPIVLAVVLALGVFFCIKLGISYAKAEKTEDREEAKKRLVGAVIGFGIGIVAAAVMWFLFTNHTILSAIFG